MDTAKTEAYAAVRAREGGFGVEVDAARRETKTVDGPACDDIRRERSRRDVDMDGRS